MVVVVAKGRTGDSQPKDIKGDPSHPTHRGTHAYALSGPVFPSLGMFYRKAGRVGSSDAKPARRHTLDGTVPSKKGYLRSKAAVQITQYLPCEHVQYSTYCTAHFGQHMSQSVKGDVACGSRLPDRYHKHLRGPGLWDNFEDDVNGLDDGMLLYSTVLYCTVIGCGCEVMYKCGARLHESRAGWGLGRETHSMAWSAVRTHGCDSTCPDWREGVVEVGWGHAMLCDWKMSAPSDMSGQMRLVWLVVRRACACVCVCVRRVA